MCDEKYICIAAAIASIVILMLSVGANFSQAQEKIDGQNEMKEGHDYGKGR